MPEMQMRGKYPLGVPTPHLGASIAGFSSSGKSLACTGQPHRVRGTRPVA